MSTFAERAIERMAPWNTGPVIDGSTDLERYLRALAAMFEPVEALAAEVGEDGAPGYTPAWGTLLDVDTAPADALPYLAMYVGVVLPTGVSEAEARELIKTHAGFSRGTRASIEAAIERNLAPGTTFQIVERRTLADAEDAYHFVITIKGKGIVQTWFTLKGSWEGLSGSWENLSGNEGFIRAAVNEVKPAGVFYSIILTEGTPWLDLEGSWENLTGTWEHLT